MIEKTDQHYKADSGKARFKKFTIISFENISSTTIIYIKLIIIRGYIYIYIYIVCM